MFSVVEMYMHTQVLERLTLVLPASYFSTLARPGTPTPRNRIITLSYFIFLNILEAKQKSFVYASVRPRFQLEQAQDEVIICSAGGQGLLFTAGVDARD